MPVSERATLDPDERSRQRSRLAQMRPHELDELLKPQSSTFFCCAFIVYIIEPTFFDLITTPPYFENFAQEETEAINYFKSSLF